jgi:chaperone modulatory protein CbpM
MASEPEAVSGELVDETAQVDLKELCAICGVHADYLVEMVEEGIIRAEGDTPTIWRFSAVSIMRSRKAIRLRRDLGINLSGLAVTLDLLDQVDRLESELKSLRRHLERLQE